MVAGGVLGEESLFPATAATRPPAPNASIEPQNNQLAPIGDNGNQSAVTRCSPPKAWPAVICSANILMASPA